MYNNSHDLSYVSAGRLSFLNHFL